jgi:hypothetical protein
MLELRQRIHTSCAGVPVCCCMLHCAVHVAVLESSAATACCTAILHPSLQVGLVSQEPTLFATSIYENIAQGRPGELPPFKFKE